MAGNTPVDIGSQILAIQSSNLQFGTAVYLKTNPIWDDMGEVVPYLMMKLKIIQISADTMTKNKF